MIVNNADDIYMAVRKAKNDEKEEALVVAELEAALEEIRELK